MSHFYTLVLVSKRVKVLDRAVRKLISRYDENIEVDEHEERCYCVGRKAQHDTNAIIDAEFGVVEELRKKFYERHPKFKNRELFDEEVDEAWRKEVTLPIEKRREELLATNPEKDIPNPKCEECGGTGIYKSHYNPDSKWDWWVIGGRWSDTLENDVQPVKELLKFKEKKFDECAVPYALVTPDGEWHERGQMGWWGMSSNDKEKSAWRDEVRSLLEKHKECNAVVVDCHI